ncbi:hypothetical protein ACFXAZ_07670 [Streptomyces sp. NPDC059477]|uniref:hypothetical protein n=1 Tax=Streptomyces sp. NPDC059477 TaxID=3346847 RepID=UPI0036A0F9FE
MSSDLPASAIEALIRPHVGEVSVVQRTVRGFSSDLTAQVDSARGRFFVKAVRNRPGGRVASLARERLINPYVRPISPPIRWDVKDADWIVLGFTWAEGRSASLRPGSADLPGVVELVESIGVINLPHPARGWAETRWDRFTESESEAVLLQGDALLHTGINPGNVLVGKRGLWAVDWAWPTRGAAFIDPALLVLQLVAAGHDPAGAESWVSPCEAWSKADPNAIDAFAAATLRMYRFRVSRKPGTSWLETMVAACEAWSGYRGVRLPRS